MTRSRPFDNPVQLPNGKIALTPKGAGDDITKLPADLHKHPKSQKAMHVLIEAAEDRGPMTFARIGMMQAIQRDVEPNSGPAKRMTPAMKWGRRKLAKDL